MRGGRSSFDAAAAGAGVVGFDIGVVSLDMGLAVVDLDTDGSIEANWGSGNPAAFASLAAASCASIRW